MIFPLLIVAVVGGGPATEYWGAIYIGTPAEKYNVLFDTGSGNLVIPGVGCESTACTLHHRYNPKKSSSSFVHNGADGPAPKSLSMFGLGDQSDLAVSYGSGGASAQMVSEKVCLTPDDACVDMNMLMATEESQVFATLGADGVLGLGLPDLALTGQYSILSAFQGKGALPKNVFSLWLGADQSAGAMITFGGFRDDQYEGKMVWSPVAEDSGFWAVDATMAAGDKKLTGSRAVLDTGSSVIAVPADVHEFLKNQPCDKSPDLFITVGDTQLRLPSKLYRPSCDNLLVAPMSVAATADSQDALQDQWVLGDPFLRHYLSVFDMDERKVGFAKAKRAQAGLLGRTTTYTNYADSGLVSINLEKKMILIENNHVVRRLPAPVEK